MSDPPPHIDASPTKEFFIYMLVRDVPLVRAIVDLVDNSLDGAQRMVDAVAPATTPVAGSFDVGVANDLAGFRVDLTINRSELLVEDNCGGISYEIARDYAFRFGRDPNAPHSDRSIGQFGVGMKRTIFKVGNEFHLRSISASSRFTMTQNVKQWLADAKKWNFDFETLDRSAAASPSERGTTLRVINLHPAVADLFGRITFENELRNELEQAHATSIQRGFAISVNGIPLGIQEFKLLSSDRLEPAFTTLTVPPPEGAEHGVTIRIYAGLSRERSLEKGGWYVFCNGRQVLDADQSATTGWTSDMETGESSTKPERVPKYHADFAFFRGFVFFDARDAGLLPWTTTKTGVDADSPIFRTARREMMRLMRPITKFLRELAAEANDADQASGDAPLAEAMSDAAEVSYSQVVKTGTFVAPARHPRTKKDTVKVQYDLLRSRLELAQQRLGATSAKQVGEMTFDYFFDAECE